MSSHLTLLELVKSCVFSTPYMTCKTVWKISIKEYWTSSKGKSDLVVLAFGKCSFFFPGKLDWLYTHISVASPSDQTFSLCACPQSMLILLLKLTRYVSRHFAVSSYRGICGLDINENIANWTEEWGKISTVLRAALLCSISFPSLYRGTRGVSVFHLLMCTGEKDSPEIEHFC